MRLNQRLTFFHTGGDEKKTQNLYEEESDIWYSPPTYSKLTPSGNYISVARHEVTQHFPTIFQLWGPGP